MKLPARRAERERLFKDRAYRHEPILAALGRTGLTMSVKQVADLTGYGPGVEIDLQLMAAYGLIGRIGEKSKARFFLISWLKVAS